MSTRETPKAPSQLVTQSPEAKADRYLLNILSMCQPWHVMSQETTTHWRLLADLADKGAIKYRTHYAEKFPQGVLAYELTEMGLEMLEAVADRLLGEEQARHIADEASEQREFYRKETSDPNTWKVRNAVAMSTFKPEA